MSKETIATVKAFIRKNFKAGTLFVTNHSDFDGMTDGMMTADGIKRKAVSDNNVDPDYTMGIKGIYFVHKNNFFSKIPNGYSVYNCCTSFSVTNA